MPRIAKFWGWVLAAAEANSLARRFDDFRVYFSRDAWIFTLLPSVLWKLEDSLSATVKTKLVAGDVAGLP